MKITVTYEINFTEDDAEILVGAWVEYRKENNLLPSEYPLKKFIEDVIKQDGIDDFAYDFDAIPAIPVPSVKID